MAAAGVRHERPRARWINYDAGTVEVADTTRGRSAQAGGEDAVGQRTARPDRPTGSATRPAGRIGFSRDSRGYLASRLKLTRYAGHAVSPQFTMNTDNVSAEQGWYLDDIRVYTCGRGAGAEEHAAHQRHAHRRAAGSRRTPAAGRRRDVKRRGPVVRRRARRIAGRDRHVVPRRGTATSGSGISVKVTATVPRPPHLDLLGGHRPVTSCSRGGGVVSGGW